MMETFRTIAIAGAGPAGARLAALLARAGIPAILIDGRGGREKPCGGGLTARAWRGREVLEGATGPRVELREAVLEAGAASIRTALPAPVRVWRRRDLDALLLEDARAAGARIVEGRVRAIEGEPGRFRILLDDGRSLEASFVAGADGAGGPCRRLFGGRLRSGNALARGFHALRKPGDDVLWIRFPPGLAGYAWSFPRTDHVSIGICSRDPSIQPARLDALLREALAASGRAAEPIPGTQFSHPVPDFAGFEGARSGPGWALIGDAGAFVDPITLEGIAGALRSAEVLAECLISRRPDRFEEAWRADGLGRELRAAAAFAPGFYGEGFPERMVRCAEAHPRVERILGGLMAGTGGYRWLRLRTAGAALADRANLFFEAECRPGRERRP